MDIIFITTLTNVNGSTVRRYVFPMKSSSKWILSDVSDEDGYGWKREEIDELHVEIS